ncbi:MAG: EAL domain-containing protein [Pseudomonadales bacterium]
MQSWYLEGYFLDDEVIHRYPVREFPFLLGRQANLSLTISSPSISRRHAQITLESGLVTIDDVGSVNGTYVNRRIIDSPTPLRHGDIIHIGDVEMRLMKTSSKPASVVDNTVMLSPDLSSKIPYGASELEAILEEKAVMSVFQPIMNGDGKSLYGYEILGRGTSEMLPRSPAALFSIAESVGMEVQLSELMRNVGMNTAAELGLKGKVFVNTHPSELCAPDKLLKSISDLRKRVPQLDIVLEIHEHAFTDSKDMKIIKDELNKMSIMLAYDDFGVGQSRLLELVEATPDFLKFDLLMIQDINLAGPDKFDLVRQLHDMAKRLNIATIAECVSQQEEYDICRSIGFDHYQGFLFSVPKSPDELR